MRWPPAGNGPQYEEICRLRSPDEAFRLNVDALVTSTGEVISVEDGMVVNRLAFPHKNYQGKVVLELA